MSQILGRFRPLVGHINGVSSINLSQTRGMRLYREKLIRLMYWRSRSFDAVKYPDRKRSDWQGWNYKSEIFAFSRRLQENLSEETLRVALAHPSYRNVLKMTGQDLNLPEVQITTNEELVESGSRIMRRFLKQYFRHHFRDVPEEGITAIVNCLESEIVLADIAKWIGCKDIILTQEYPPSSTSMAASVPAVIGGIQRDLGDDRAKRFIVDMIVTYLNDVSIPQHVWQIPNPKETLNLILSNSKMSSYEPRIIFQTGVKTLEACHIVGVYSDKQFLGSSPGETLAIAEECACLNALFRLFGLESPAPFTYGEKSEKIDYSSHDEPHESLVNWKFNKNNIS